MKKTLKERFDEKWIPEPNSGCWLWSECIHKKKMYGMFKIGDKCKAAHHVSYDLYCEPVDEKYTQIYHKCNNKLCVNPDHLSPYKNTNSTSSKQRYKGIRKSTKRKLTLDQLNEIRESKDTQMNLAKKYGVVQSTISFAKNSVTYIKT
jgi:hypothetical protein